MPCPLQQSLASSRRLGICDCDSSELARPPCLCSRTRCCPPESPSRTYIDALPDSVYICHVPARKLQVGQVWKKEDTGESYLVTKVYNEALTTYAILRKAGAESERPVKVKVDRQGPAYKLPGFSYAQESDEF
jgi:hypothetical protein